MTREERQIKAEATREELKDVMWNHLVKVFNKTKDMNIAWKRTERLMRFIIFKDPQRASLARDAFIRVKIMVRENAEKS